jgi:hypothetical protein
MSERFVPWLTLEGVPPKLFVEAIHDDVEGLRFLLRGHDPAKPTLRIKFEAAVGYQNINESYRLATWARVRAEGPLPTLLIIEDSEWLKWLVQEAGGVLDSAKLVHYAIYSLEDCIDVASEFEPVVDWPNG